jgi:A/G-specific adenine glycosylase
MLQQTQVSRVVPKYRDFLRLFPTMGALARASKREVVIAWRGLGYNNRAVRLHSLAQQLHAAAGGRLPRDIRSLMRLPGVGRYTAHALAVFAFDRQLPVVDVNVRRVLSRLFFPMTSTGELVEESHIRAIAAGILPRGKAFDWNQALMDLGATVCTSSRPACDRCPVHILCRSRAAMIRQTRSSAPKHGPLHRGVPIRLYRGRIISALRDADDVRGLPARRLGKAVLPSFTERDRAVFHRMLRALERDGLVEIRRGRSAEPERVALA